MQDFDEWISKSVSCSVSKAYLTKIVADLGLQRFVETMLSRANDLTPAQIHAILEFAKGLPAPKPIPIKTIAFFYHRFYCGGVERVMSEQFKFFLSLGYRVVLLTEMPPTNQDFATPPEVTREVVSEDPAKRLEELRKIFERHKVDLYYTHVSFAKQTFWDLLAVRFVLGKRVVVHAHGIFPCSLVWGTDDLQERLDLYSIADETIVLTRADEFYYRSYGVKCRYIPNPIPAIARPSASADERRARRTVLSVGRICQVKQTLDVLKAAKVLQKTDPTIKFLVVGNRENQAYWNQVWSYYKKAGLGATVNFMDYTKDVESVYRQGSILLVTSQLEGFPMVLSEAQGAGLPIVMYDLPYIEVERRPNSGIFAVDHGDADALAWQIKKLLDDPKLYGQASSNARALYENMRTEVDFCQAYASVLADAMDECPKAIVGSGDARAAFEALVKQMRTALKISAERGWRDGFAADKRMNTSQKGRSITANAASATARIAKMCMKGIRSLRELGLAATLAKAKRKLRTR